MASTAQILANRDNAQHSTGPRTEAGKARSAANAKKHGLSSAFTVLPNEDHDEYDEIFNGFIEEFDPAGYHETFLVHELIHARWRTIRIHRLERVWLENAQLDNPAADPDQAILANMADKGIDIMNALGRYQAAAQRAYYKAHKELLQGRLTATRQAAADSRRESAELDRAINEYISPPVRRQQQASNGHSTIESNQPLSSSVPSNTTFQGPAGTTDFTHATRQNLRAPAL